MFDILQVVTVLLVAAAMALTLAHALELPGKMRLTKDVYYAMQHRLRRKAMLRIGRIYAIAGNIHTSRVQASHSPV